MSEQKITTHIKAPNKDWEVLKNHFPQCFDKDGKFDIVKFQQQLNTQNIELTTEKVSYGLEWLGKSYARLLASDPATTLLKADEIHNAKPENANSENLLIKGDNLEVLKHLANAYYEKVKMIYIDPPYNTGSDGFVYNDDRKYTVKELQNLIGIDEEKAKRILDFTQSKSNSHSAWLTFMYPRLYIAKQLLRDDGVIFVSIDDNEVAQLRLLMDEIFGEENFVAEFIWQTKNAARGVPPNNRLMANHEYIISYAKCKEKHIFIGIERDKKDFSNPDNDPRGLWRSESIRATGTQNNIFTIIDPKTQNKFEGNYAFSKKKIEEMIKNDLIIFPKDPNGVPRQKKFYSSYTNDKKAFVTSLGWYSTENSTKYLMSLFENRKVFDFPKPLELINFLIKQQTSDQGIILDFFAGSGTTGDAVMQLNAEDGGNRKYILVQLPEPIDPKKNRVAYDFVKNELKAEPTIFEITKERLIRAAKKVKTEKIDTKIEEKEKELQELQNQLNLKDKEEKIKKLQDEIEALKSQDLGFKIFETIPIWDDYNFEAEKFDSSQTLFDTGKLTEDDIKALLTTWKTYDGISLTQDLESIDLSGYTSYYGNDKLYLMHKGFTTDHLKTLLEKIDTDKNFEPKSIIAFGYHFESARLRELSENVKNYANKKHIDIDFVIRY